MSPFVKNTIYFVLAVFVFIVFYSGYVILQAKEETPAIFAKALKAENIAISLKDFGKARETILLKIEDPGFYAHHGVDYDTPGQGLTTIPQAMVKNLYFKDFKPGTPKLKQSLIAAFALTPLISKKDQLTVFINTAYFGHQDKQDVKGFAQASQVYFDKTFPELSEDEYIALVAMLIAPNAYHIKRFPNKNALRVSRIKQVLSGDYKPKSLMDQFYDQ